MSHPVPGSAVRLTDWAEPEPSFAGSLHAAALLHFLPFLPPFLSSFLRVTYPLPSSLRLFPPSFLPASFLLYLLPLFLTHFLPVFPPFLLLPPYLCSFFTSPLISSSSLPLFLTPSRSSLLISFLPPSLPNSLSSFFPPSLSSVLPTSSSSSFLSS